MRSYIRNTVEDGIGGGGGGGGGGGARGDEGGWDSQQA